MRQNFMRLLTILSILMVMGCSAQVEEKEEAASQTPITQTEKTDQSKSITRQSAAQGEQHVEKEEEAVNQGEENNEALAMLQAASDVMKTIKSVDYSAYSQTDTQYVNPDNPDTLIEYSYVNDDYGSLQRDPAIAYTRNHNVMAESEVIDEVTYNDISAQHQFSDYYVSKADGVYYKYDDVGEWFKGEEVSADFKTVGHVEALIDLFMQYPDQLVMTNNLTEAGEEEEEIEGVNPDIYYTISLDLTNEQYVELVPMLISNFFTGTYDRVMAYEDQTFMLISDELLSYRLSLTLDEAYGLVALDTNFEATLLDGLDREGHQYVLSLYFFNFNAVDEIMIPEEVFLSTFEVENVF